MDNNQSYNQSNRGFGNESNNNNQQYSETNQSNNTNYQQTNNNAYTKQIIKLPNSGAILTLGILSIVTLCCCGPTIGPILAIIAIALSVGVNRELKSKPGYYSSTSIGNFKAGKICAIIGLSIGLIIFLIYFLGVILDTAFNQDIIDAFNDVWNEMNY